MEAAQGTQAWLDARKGRLTGSRIGAILGLSKYASRDDVMREMVREHHGAEREFEGNEATQHGHDCEPVAIGIYERETGQSVKAASLVVHPEYEWLAASPDGLIGDDGLIEVKSPYRGTYTSIEAKPEYAAQIQLQLACTGREWCDFVIYRNDSIIIERVPADGFWLHTHLDSLMEFRDEFMRTIADDELSARHLAPLVRTDAKWTALEAEYADAKAEADKANDRLEAAKKALIEAAGGQSQRGNLAMVIKSERKGTTDYAKAIKVAAPDFDLAPYTKPSTVVYSVKECK